MKKRTGMVTTRFAPSPTGVLHIGSARTALYCYLYAKHKQGKFILRIEDTDLERSTPESVKAIFDGMQWLGLSYDEGPYFQTKRFERYREVANQLLETGHAYRCACTKERLEALRAQQIANKEKPRYDGHCRNQRINHDTQHVIRFKNPQHGEVIVNDLLLGLVAFANTELDDLIIQRSDGAPTYNFTVVVDDWDMQITHVIRGNDHLNNTPRQINILNALNAKIPFYVHLPMIHGRDGKKMSKRDGAVGVMEFRDDGYLPQAILNYLIRLGWSHGDQEVFSLSEMVQFFDLNNLNKSPAIFDLQKLQWLNQHYLKTLPATEVAPHLIWHMDALDINYQSGPRLEDIIVIQAERCKTLREMAERSRFFYEPPKHFDEKAAAQHLTKAVSPHLVRLMVALEQLDHWQAPQIHHTINMVAQEAGLDNMGKLAQPVRIAVSGGTVSPPIDATLELLGKGQVIGRLQHALAYIEQHTK
jgi:glutamyl-tRNA synthetase